ncbi:MAG TPA: hypothetical protein VIX73_24110, partial [Kofleriaceae bacterium]
MRVRAGATAIVALITTLPLRVTADDRTPTGRAAGCSTTDCKALYHTIATLRSRAQLSEFLVGPAQRAAKSREWARAIPLYQALVVARGPGSAEAKQLAMLWTLAGQNERAAEAWKQYSENAADAKERD